MLEHRRYIFGEMIEPRDPLTLAEATQICLAASRKRAEFANYPIDKVLRVLDRLKILWSNPDFEPRKRLIEILPENTGFSRQMIELAFNELPAIFDPGALSRKLDTELRGLRRAPDWNWNSKTRTCTAVAPLGVVLHVLSGNVFLVAAGALVQGLITGNISILKMSSDEKLFLPTLLETLKSVDEDGVISSSVAAVDYSSDMVDVIDVFKSSVDGIAVWGGESAVLAYRANLSAGTRFIVFGPRISLAVVTENGIAEFSLSGVAKGLADDISIWDQNACTAPQVCFVQGFENALRLAEQMKLPLEALSGKLPSGKIGFEEAIEIRKLRTTAEIAGIRGSGNLVCSEKNLDFTVLVEKDQVIELSPLHRTLKIKPFDSIEEVVEAMKPLRGYLQTVGLAVGGSERNEISQRLVEAGSVRFTQTGRMAGGEIDDPHDGEYDLPKFVNTVFDRRSEFTADYFPLDFCPDHQRAELIDSRLRTLIDHASNSPFYRARLESHSVKTVDDLQKLPALTRYQLEQSAPPFSREMLAHNASGGYVSRSGGSTGEPRYSWYDDHDWEAMIGNAVRLFFAMGLEKGDRLANCFMAGDLYGGFVSFDHINARLGVTNFAFAGNLKPEVLHRIWKQFGLNAIMGVPPIFMPVLRDLKKRESAFNIEKIIFAGAPLSGTDRKWLESELQVKRISSVIGANDGGQIGFQCSEMIGNRHHAIDDFNYIEIVDDQDRRVPDGEPGKILITSLLKFAVPLIRYEIGDSGRIVPEKCSCGRSIRVFEYLGRSDDTICVGLLNMRTGDFRAAWSEFPITEIQLVARFGESMREHLLIRVEAPRPEMIDTCRMLDTLLQKIPSLSERIQNSVLGPLEIEVLSLGTLERNPRTGKVKAFSDER